MSLASIAGFPRRALLWVAALAVLVPASAWATEIYSSMEVPKAVGAASTTSSVTIDTNGRLTIGKIACSFYITHSWPSDLQISLLAPDGTRVYFTKFEVGGWPTATGGDNRRGDINTGFGTGIDFAQRVTIDDGAEGRDLHVYYPPSIPAGSYQGYNDDMADFCNKSADGTWTLQVEDGFPALDFGRLVCWSLHIDPIVHRYWTGGGNNTRLSNRFNWRDGIPPLPGEGAAALHFVGPAPDGPIINDIYRMTIAELEVSGGAYSWMTLEDPQTGLGPFPIAFANNAIVSVTNGSFSVLNTSVIHRDHNIPYEYNHFNRKPQPNVYQLETVELSAHLRGLTNFNIGAGGTMSFQGMVMDWVRRHDVGNTNLLVPRLEGSVFKDLEGTLNFNHNGTSQPPGWPYIDDGSRYTGETVIKNGVLSIAHRRGLGRVSYIDNNALPQYVDTGTIVDGGTLELRNVALNVSDNTREQDSELSLVLRGLGFQGAGALRVAASQPLPIAAYAASVTGNITLGYVTGAVVNEGDDVNPLSTNSVGIGALERSTLRFDAGNIGGDPLPIRVVGGMVATNGDLIPGGTVNWYATVPSHFAVSERTTCNMEQNIRYDDQNRPIEIVPDNIPDTAILAVLNGARLNFKESCVNYNKTRPGGTLVTDVDRAYRYVETVKTVQMGGGVLAVVNNGVLQINDGAMSTLSTTSEVTGPSQIMGHVDFRTATPLFEVTGDDTLAEHLILSHNENLDYQADDYPSQNSRLLNGIDRTRPIIDATGLLKSGRGTMALATHLTFQGDATVNAGGLVVSNNLRNVIGGTVVGNVTVNDGFVAGRGEVGAILVTKGGVMPGRPAIEGATAYQLPTNQTLVLPRPLGPPLSAGTLTCDSVNFVSDKTTFTTGIYDPSGICDRLRIADTANGFVSLGMSGGASCSLRPLWRSADPAQGDQWMVIIDNGLTQLPNGNFTGMPQLPATLSPWICYSFDKGADATADDIQPHDPLDPAVPADLAFINKMTNGYSVAIRINGIVNFRPNSLPDEKLAATYVVPEVNEADGSAVTVALPVDASGPGKVSYQTIDWTALAGVDYTPGEGQVDAPGTGPQVSITYNQTIRESRSLKVELLAPTNGLALGRPTTATISILDVNQPDDEKTTGCGMSSGFAVFLLFIAGLGRLVVLRRRRD